MTPQQREVKESYMPDLSYTLVKGTIIFLDNKKFYSVSLFLDVLCACEIFFGGGPNGSVLT